MREQREQSWSYACWAGTCSCNSWLFLHSIGIGKEQTVTELCVFSLPTPPGPVWQRWAPEFCLCRQHALWHFLSWRCGLVIAVWWGELFWRECPWPVCVSAALLSPLPTTTSSLFHSTLPFGGKCHCNWSPHLLLIQKVQELGICFLSSWIGMPPALPSATTPSQRIKEEYGQGGYNSSPSVHVKGPLRTWVGKWHIQRHWQIGGTDAHHLHPLHFRLMQTFRNRHCLKCWHQFSSSFHCLNCNIHYFYNWIFNLQIKGQSFKKEDSAIP